MELLLRQPGSEVSALTSIEEILALVGVFQGIADEEGWSPSGQLTAFAQSAVYFQLTVDHEVAGGLQLVRPSATGLLPTHAVWPELRRASCTEAHVTMLALKRAFRGVDGLFWLLCAEMWRYCWCQGISRLWLEATPPTFKAYRRFGWPLEVVGDLRVHWGEECFPCQFELSEAARVVGTRAIRSKSYRKVFEQLFRPAQQPGDTVVN